MRIKIIKEDSLKKRYSYKLGASLCSLPITLIAQTIIPRMLGPVAYGNFSFLSTFFNQVINFFDFGLSSAFYSKLSHRPEEYSILRFFWGIAWIISSLMIFTVLMIFSFEIEDSLWPNQKPLYIWMAAGFGLLTWYSLIINKIMDAYGLTVNSEIIRFKQKIFSLILLSLLVGMGWFNLTSFFLYHYALLIFICVYWRVILKKNNQPIIPTKKLSRKEIRLYSQEFYHYSSPLILFTFVGLLTGILDRWLLQHFAGSMEQGFYGLSYQIGIICFLVSGSMTPLFWREISKAFGEKNSEKMRSMYRRYTPLLYSIAALLSIFVMVQAKKISFLIGGNAFQEAAIPISIMALYPIHQTYGQLNGVFYLGTGQTKLYSNLGISIAVLDLFLVFWFLAPASLFGLDLGATGLSLKMVITQFISVNLQLWFICKNLNLTFLKFLFHQIYVIFLLSVLAWGSMNIVDLIINGTLLAFILSGIIYLTCCAGALFLIPSIIAMSRNELIGYVSKGYRLIHQKIYSYC